MTQETRKRLNNVFREVLSQTDKKHHQSLRKDFQELLEIVEKKVAKGKYL